MSGKELKEQLKAKGVTNITKLAEMMGRSNQRLFASMASQDVKSGLIEDITKVLGLDVADFYQAGNTAIAADGVSMLRVKTLRIRPRNPKKSLLIGSPLWLGNKRVTKGIKKCQRITASTNLILHKTMNYKSSSRCKGNHFI